MYDPIDAMAREIAIASRPQLAEEERTGFRAYYRPSNSDRRLAAAAWKFALDHLKERATEYGGSSGALIKDERDTILGARG